MKKPDINFYIVMYSLALFSLIAIAAGYGIVSIPLIILMNVLAYRMVNKKYKNNPHELVENNRNDMTILYLCKFAACFWISAIISIVLVSFRFFETIGTGMIFIILIIFNLTPSVKKGVRTLQEREIHKIANKK